jgi:hypothetical protein
MKGIRSLILPALLICIAGCKKTPKSSEPAPLFGAPVVTAKGQAVGTAVTQQIDAAGGTLTSQDGKLTITVPAGTVSVSTTFSIQPITNTLTQGKPAYRLLPEGVTLAKPVQLSFRYNNVDLVNTNEDLLILYFQTTQGSWQSLPTSLDKNRKLLMASTTHFSDWVAGGALQMEISKNALSAGESSEIKVFGIGEISTGIHLLAPLIEVNDYFDGFISKVGNWQVLKSSGTITGKASSSNAAIIPEATYKAPATIIQTDSANIQVEIEGELHLSDLGREVTFKKVVLLANIYLVPDVYMLIDFGGTTAINTVTAISGNGAISIGGYAPNVNITLNANGNGVGTYPCGGTFDPVKSFINISVNPSSSSNKIYISTYQQCGPPRVEKYSPGVLKITKWSGIGQTVEGEFNGPVYTSDGTACGVTDKDLHVQFRTVRSI